VSDEYIWHGIILVQLYQFVSVQLVRESGVSVAFATAQGCSPHALHQPVLGSPFFWGHTAKSRKTSSRGVKLNRDRSSNVLSERKIELCQV
jgi:hypothetical protein